MNHHRHSDGTESLHLDPKKGNLRITRLSVHKFGESPVCIEQTQQHKDFVQLFFATLEKDKATHKEAKQPAKQRNRGKYIHFINPWLSVSIDGKRWCRWGFSCALLQRVLPLYNPSCL